MNELLQKHGCSNVFTVPKGLKELMSDITREVLREQPAKIYDFIENYLSVLLITREHGVFAIKILDELCDCRPSVSEHLMQIGIDTNQAHTLSDIIKVEIEGFEPVEGKEKLKETQILKKIMQHVGTLDEALTAKLCQITRNAYRDYWYRKRLLEKNVTTHPEEPWEVAAQHTLELYKTTKPSFQELNRAAERIQASYKGYYIRRDLLSHLKPKLINMGPKANLPGPPLDIAESRVMTLGSVTDVEVKEDDVASMLEDELKVKRNLKYDPMKTFAHIDKDAQFLEDQKYARSHSGEKVKKSHKEQYEEELEQAKELADEAVAATHHHQTSRLLSDASAFSQSRKSSIMSQLGGRRSVLLDEGGRGGSRAPSKIYTHSYQKISFSEMPPEVIPDDDHDIPVDDVSTEIQEDIPGEGDQITTDIDQDQAVIEDIVATSTQDVPLDVGVKVPDEDIEKDLVDKITAEILVPEEHLEGDVATPDTTDIEDATTTGAEGDVATPDTTDIEDATTTGAEDSEQEEAQFY